MPASPFQLLGFYIEEAHYFADVKGEKVGDRIRKAREAHSRNYLIKPASLEINVEIGVNQTDELKHFCRVTVQTKKDLKDLPCSFRVVASGFFHVSEAFYKKMSQEPDFSLSKMLSNQLPACVYSSIRDFVLTISSKSPYPGILLPCFAFEPLSIDLTPGNVKSRKKTKPQHEAV